jgi:DNA-binding MarR family transcriptional regulator
MISPIHERASDSPPNDRELIAVIREKRLGFSALAILLFLRAEIAETEEKIHLPCAFTTQTIIAREIGLSRVMTNRLLQGLRAAGLIEFRRGEYAFAREEKTDSILPFPKKPKRR